MALGVRFLLSYWGGLGRGSGISTKTTPPGQHPSSSDFLGHEAYANGQEDSQQRQHPEALNDGNIANINDGKNRCRNTNCRHNERNIAIGINHDYNSQADRCYDASTVEHPSVSSSWELEPPILRQIHGECRNECHKGI